MGAHKRADEIEWKMFDDESLLLNVRTGYYFRLNAVGSFIWSSLDGNRSDDEIVRLIADAFETTSEQARNDYRAFIAELVEEKLILNA
ncbi:MAG: PqqD family protein [Candidatus Neomarinimicrobiota bacterium]